MATVEQEPKRVNADQFEDAYEEDFDDYDDYLDDELNDTDLWDNATGGKPKKKN